MLQQHKGKRLSSDKRSRAKDAKAVGIDASSKVDTGPNPQQVPLPNNIVGVHGLHSKTQNASHNTRERGCMMPLCVCVRAYVMYLMAWIV
jgi:hypothetical protein|mmetsp:Transcript_5303/g.9562  ORF Transcript_5303/g.9562 Transcript_5303/m.9562 type:complete len:90 (+) Transcript_5303:853-1122(+)